MILSLVATLPNTDSYFFIISAAPNGIARALPEIFGTSVRLDPVGFRYNYHPPLSSLAHISIPCRIRDFFGNFGKVP